MSYVLRLRQRVREKVGDSSHLASVAQGEDDNHHWQRGSELLPGRREGRRDMRSSIGALMVHSKSCCEFGG